MALIAKADLARMVKVSRPAVTQAVKRKLLAEQADGTIDTALPLNAAWIKAKTNQLAAPAPVAKPKPPAKGGDTVSPTATSATGDSKSFNEVIAEMAEMGGEKLKLTRARRIQAEADTHLKDIRAAREKRILIERELVRQKLAAFDVALKTNFRDMPRRVSAQIYAIAKSEDARAVERYLEKEISTAIARAVSEAQKQDLL